MRQRVGVHLSAKGVVYYPDEATYNRTVEALRRRSAEKLKQERLAEARAKVWKNWSVTDD